MTTQTGIDYTPLTRIELALAEVGFGTDYVAENEIETAPYEHLYVLLEELTETRFLVARLAFVGDIARKGSELANVEPPDEKVSTLQISVVLPLKKSKTKLPEMTHLAGVLNRYIPMGSFGASETDGFYFRYSFLDIRPDHVNEYLVVIALETILSLIKRFLPDLGALVNEKASLDTILKKLEVKAQ